MEDDRSAFWQSIAQDVAALPLEITVGPESPYSDEKVVISAASFKSLGDFDIFCWVARPRGEIFGALVQFPAYGTVLFPPVGYAEQGLLTVSVAVRGHHGSEIPGVGFPGVLVHGLPGAETYVYRGMYGDALRAVTLVARLLAPDLRVAAMGQSQGAALSLFAAAFSGLVTVVAADVPFLCDIRSTLGQTTAFPYRELAAYLHQHPTKAKEALRTIDLIDSLGFAPLITCPVLMSIGTLDPVTPLAATRALARSLPSVEAIEYDGAGHEGGGMRHRQLQTRWLLDRLTPAPA